MNDISSRKEENATKRRDGEDVEDCVFYFGYGYCTTCVLVAVYEHDKKARMAKVVGSLLTVLTGLTARVAHMIQKIWTAQTAWTKQTIQMAEVAHFHE